jgi:hypothetical protein
VTDMLVELPENPSPDQLREAAAQAEAYAEHREAEARFWRRLAERLRVRAERR